MNNRRFNTDKPEAITYLVQPFKQVVAGYDLLYNFDTFALEQYDKNLRRVQKKFTGAYASDFNGVEDFVAQAIEKDQYQYYRSTRTLTRKGWVKVTVPPDTTVSELIKVSLEKIGAGKTFKF